MTTALFAVPLLLAGACSPGSTNTACRPLGTVQASSPNPAFAGTVFMIVMENHGVGDILDDKENGAHYVQSLAAQYTVARGYTDPFVHPSEPNYLWMAAGENFGILDDNPPIDHHIASTSHIADQLERAGLGWHAYMESMGDPCKLTAAYPYDPKHNPFVYFDDINGWNGTAFLPSARCTNNDIDYSHFATDLAAGTLPKFVFITPNLIDDMHDGTIAQGDQWLAQEIPRIQASPQYQNGGVLFLLWDEGSLSIGDDPPLLVISPLAKKGFVSHTAYTTSSLLKTEETIMGVEPLPCDPGYQSVPTMDDVFTVPLTQVAAK